MSFLLRGLSWRSASTIVVSLTVAVVGASYVYNLLYAPKRTKDYFLNAFGFRETISDVQSKIKPSLEGNTWKIQTPVQSYQVGDFYVSSVANFEKPDIASGFSFEIHRGKGGMTKDYNRVDVGGLQADPSNAGATFQVASNFNCLEFVSSAGSARDGITKYIYDKTQGPAASISAAPGTLYRNYFAEHQVGGENYIGQLDQQLNLLDDLPFIPMQNGYIVLNEKLIEDLSKIEDLSAIRETVKVGVQQDTQVLYGAMRGDIIEVCKDPKQIVNQVFTATINLGSVNALRLRKKSEDNAVLQIERLAKLLLYASYKGTILSAIENRRRNPSLPGSNKLYLTLIGGGVFGNNMDWIVDAILENGDLLKISGLETILVLYGYRGMDQQNMDRLLAGLSGKVVDVL